METTRSHSITTQMVGPNEAEDPGRADSAQQSCRHRVRVTGRVTALSSCLLPNPLWVFQSRSCVLQGDPALRSE